MTDTARLLLTLGVTLVGSGVGTAIVAALFKKRFDTQLETHKALLQRGGRINERQVDALLAIDAKLDTALSCLRQASSPAKFAGEPSEQALLQKMAGDLRAASEEFSKNRLLISDRLQRKLDEYFQKMFLAGMTFNVALDPMAAPQQRADLWNQVRDNSYNELPSILEAIRAEAKAIIER